MSHRIEFTSAAERDLSRLSKDVQRRNALKINPLADHPRPNGVEKLEGRENRYRIRIGDYRVIYEVHDEILLVLIIRIGHRREVYRR
jgi:mRNA interferase RelE/StbE